MDNYKQFICKLREFALKEKYIIINDDIAPKLKHYVRLLDQIEFEDGSYHEYYGKIKNIVNSFTNHWTEVMDVAIKEADRIIHLTTRDDLLNKMDNTIAMHVKKQADFENEFTPTQNPLEREIFDDINARYINFMGGLEELKNGLMSLDKPDKVDAFAKEHFQFSLKNKNEVFAFTYELISFKLTSNIDRIRVSLVEILNRIKNNERTMHETSEVNISHLLIRLYEKNKEHLMLSRQDIRSSVEIAEVQRSMEILKDEIEDSKLVPMQRLEDECAYWEARLKEFYQIEKTWKKILVEEGNLLEKEKLFYKMKDKYKQITAVKKQCWENMLDKFKKTLYEFNATKLNAAKALLTFFSVRGPDRIFYKDNIGTYYVDDYGHQCYVFDYGLNVYHVNCEGQFVEPNENERYFYDNNGRFIATEDGEKLYKIAPCASTYDVKNDVFVKHTKDCGHSDVANKQCRMTVKDPMQRVVLPDVQPGDLRGKLDTDSEKYLWETFGHILPQVLYDVADVQPKSPIHYLAHQLLLHKYQRSKGEMLQKKSEASAYRDRMHQTPIENLSNIHKAWKAKQVKRRKPEESDDTEDRLVYIAHQAQQDLIRSLENYYV